MAAEPIFPVASAQPLPDDAGMKKRIIGGLEAPAHIDVGDLRAVPYRPPSSRDPRWAWRCRKSGETIWSGRGTPKEVARKLAAILLEEPESEPEIELVETVGQMIDLWYTNEADLPDREEATRLTYRSSARRIDKLIGSIRIDRGAWVLDQLILQAQRVGLAHSTQKLTQTVMVMAWAWAYGHDLVTVPPPPKRKLKGKASKGKTRIPPTVEQAKRAIAAVREPWRSALWVQLATGARIGEICALQVADVDDRAARVILTIGIHEGARKTGERIVPVTAFEAIRAIRKAVAEAKLAGRDRLWRGPMGGRLATNGVGAQLRRVPWADEAVDCPRFVTHALRYLAVLQMRQRGVPVEQAAELLGHSITMMLSVYRHISEGELVEAMDRVRLGEASE